VPEQVCSALKSERQLSGDLKEFWILIRIIVKSSSSSPLQVPILPRLKLPMAVFFLIHPLQRLN
jgi:hypothetical protein